MRFLHIITLGTVLATGLTSVGCNDKFTGLCGKQESTAENFPTRTPDRVSIQQGVWGNVWFWEGNFMPPCGTGTVTPVGREIRIYLPTTLRQVEETVVRDGAEFYQRVNTPLVATVWADAQGFFQVALPVGQYSLFSVEDSLLYPFGIGANGELGQLDIDASRASEAHFDIRYRSAW